MKIGPLNITRRLAEKSTAKPQFVELGATGTVILQGQLCETEYNADLQGTKGLNIFEKMRTSDGQVKGTLMACTLPLRVANWNVEAASDEPIDKEIAKAVSDNLFDQMTITWDDFLRQALIMLPMGFSPFEKVWELANGFYRYRKFAPRLPKTITEWTPDKEGGLAGLVQTAYKDGVYKIIPIPVDKLLVFINDKEGSNFAGTSILRAAYKHWYYKDVLYRIDGIAAERHGVGVAVFTLPSTATTEGTGSDQDKIDKIGTGLHAHERSYISLPEGFGFDLKGVTGQIHDTMKSIEHHNVQISLSILLQFMNLGAQGVGSYAQSTDQSGFFLMALEAVGRNICETVNRYAIPQMVNYNWDRDKYPKLKMASLERREIATYSRAVADLVYAGALTPDEGIEDELRSALKFKPRKAPPAVGETSAPPVRLPKGSVEQEAPATTGKQGKTGDAAENIVEGEKLNSIQIQAAMEVLWSYIKKNVPDTVAIELLVAVGIDRVRAQSMVNACKNFEPVNPETPPASTEQKTAKLRETVKALRSIVLAEPQEIRRPRGFESFVAFDDMERKLDTAEEKFISGIRDVERRQISQIVTTIMNKASSGGDPSKAVDIPIPFRVDLERTIEGILLDLYDFGKQQVANELAKQRKSIKAADGEAKAVSVTPTELIKTRAKATANVLSAKLQAAMSYEVLRQMRAGSIDRDLLETALVNLSTAELIATAKWSVSEALNLGRGEEAKANSGDIDRAIYSAIMDRGTCDECASQDGKEFPYPSVEWDEVNPPNKKCSGQDRCRCVGVYVLKSERA